VTRSPTSLQKRAAALGAVALLAYLSAAYLVLPTIWVTHHIAPDVDAERDYLLGDLERTGALPEIYSVDGFHKILTGRNGGGDRWQTDGRLFVGVIAGE
jgi:hypothetical protein